MATEKVAVLLNELVALRKAAGNPSGAGIARAWWAASGKTISETTVRDLFNRRLVEPPWETVAAVVVALDGDVRYFHRLWLATLRNRQGP